MAIVLEEEVTGTGGAVGDTDIVTGSNLSGSAGLFIAEAAFRQTGTVASVVGGGLTWSLVGAKEGDRGVNAIEVWKAEGTPTGGSAFAVTVNLNQAAASQTLRVRRYSGYDTTTPIDSVSTAGTGGADTSTAAITHSTAVDGSLAVVAALTRNRTISSEPNYDEGSALSFGVGGALINQYFAIQDMPTAGSCDFSATLSNTADWALVAFAIRPEADSGFDGTGAVTSAAPTAAASGALSFTATGAVSSVAPTVSASGALAFAATGAVTTVAPSAAASGSLAFSATGAVTTVAPSAAVEGALAFSGEGAVTSAAPTVSGSGPSATTGEGAVSTAAPAASASGALAFAGTGAPAAVAPTAESEGELVFTGTSAVTSESPTVVGTSPGLLVGTGAVTIVVATVAGQGSLGFSGTGAVTSAAPTALGISPLTISGTGAVITAAPIASASGEVPSQFDLDSDAFWLAYDSAADELERRVLLRRFLLRHGGQYRIVWGRKELVGGVYPVRN